MKKAWPILITVWITTFTGLVTLASANPVNGSFESVGFDGWSLRVSPGGSSQQPRNRSAGLASLVSSWQPPFALNSAYAPVDGNKFAMLETLAAGNYSGQRTYQVSLSQQLYLEQGDTISGWSFFFNGDYEARDSAWVKLLDANGTLVATPWLDHSGNVLKFDLHSVPYQSATLWTHWSWQSPESGTYTLSLGMTTSGDNNYASYGFFDHIFVVPLYTPVPEPTTLAPLALGAAMVAGWRRKRN